MVGLATGGGERETLRGFGECRRGVIRAGKNMHAGGFHAANQCINDRFGLIGIRIHFPAGFDVRRHAGIGEEFSQSVVVQMLQCGCEEVAAPANFSMRKSTEPALVKLHRPPPHTNTLMPGRMFFSKIAIRAAVPCSASPAATAAIMPAAGAENRHIERRLGYTLAHRRKRSRGCDCP